MVNIAHTAVSSMKVISGAICTLVILVDHNNAQEGVSIGRRFYDK
jgi:hypothetical protein